MTTNCDISNTILNSCDLSGSLFVNTNLYGVDIRNCNLKDIDFLLVLLIFKCYRNNRGIYTR